MAKKKTTQVPVSQEENVQAQRMFAQYHQIATNLHESRNQEQAEAVLAEINALPEGAQLTLLKVLSKERHVDAADVVAALNELSPLKTIRKEAKRSLIQLEGARISPQWQSPLDHTPPINLIQLNTNPPRFWKGLVTDTRSMGQVQLFLFWEQGDGYGDVRILGFYLDFEDGGVKNFFTALESKRSADKFIASLGTDDPDLQMKDCSLSAGRRLLRNALRAHKEHGTKPPFDYQSHISLINQLILETSEVGIVSDQEEEAWVDLHGLAPEEVVANFVGLWVDEDFDLAYDLLSSNSTLREGLSKDDWIESREDWADEAVPDALEPNFIYEREQPQSKIWLPDLWTVNYAATHKEVVAGWSIELEKISEDDMLPEVPKATIVYEETNRHWFWASYILIQEDGEWRIQRMNDEGANAQTLSIQELQEKTRDLDRYVKELLESLLSEDIEEISVEGATGPLALLMRRVLEGTCYTDALIKKLPLDQSLYEGAATRMLTLTQYERSLAYLAAMTRRFPQKRGQLLRRIAAVQQELGEDFFAEDESDRGAFYLDLASKSLHDSLNVENSFEAHMSLVDLLIEYEEEIEHVEQHLLAAQKLMNGPDEESHVEMHLGEIANKREQYQDALSHFQRVLDLKPDSAGAWSDVGEAYEALEQFAEAESHYKRALELAPDTNRYYYRLSQLYRHTDRLSQAIEVVEQAIAANPDAEDSAVLHVHMAEISVEIGDYAKAEEYMSKAEQLDPESELVSHYRKKLNIPPLP